MLEEQLPVPEADNTKQKPGPHFSRRFRISMYHKWVADRDEPHPHHEILRKGIAEFRALLERKR